MSTKQEHVSYLVGWLEGFAGSAWALCNVQEREVVCPELIAEYEDKVKELRETLDTDFTSKVTFKPGEYE